MKEMINDDNKLSERLFVILFAANTDADDDLSMTKGGPDAFTFCMYESINTLLISAVNFFSRSRRANVCVCVWERECI